MKRSAGESSIPITQHVAAHREVLLKQKEQVPTLRQQRQRMEALVASCGECRWRRRQKRDLEREMAKLDETIRRFETDEHIRDFERQAVPYMEAFVRHAGAPKYKVSRFVVPGEPSTRLQAGAGSQSQSDVVAEYLTAVQHDAPKPCVERSVDACPRCADTEMVLVPAKAILVCPKCGRSASFLDATSSAISYDESVEMVTFSYKRGNHFQDWLSNVQGLEAYEVPQEVIDAVMNELYKQRVTDLREITTKRVRGVLKTFKLRKCYDHVAQITSRVTGRPPPRLPPQAAELCRLMFTAVQIPFQKYCPPTRKNFLSYSYILNKMLYILGYDELCDTLTMLKGQDKIKRMDEVWKLIAADLDWEWFPTTTT